MNIVSMFLWLDLFSALKFKTLLRYFILAATSFISNYRQSRLCLSIFLYFLVLFCLLKVLVYSNFVYLQLYLIQTIWEKTTTTFWLRFNLFLGTKFVSSGIGLLVQSIKPKKMLNHGNELCSPRCLYICRG